MVRLRYFAWNSNLVKMTESRTENRRQDGVDPSREKAATERKSDSHRHETLCFCDGLIGRGRLGGRVG